MASASLSSRRDFRRVYRAGMKARADGVTVWAAPVAGSTPGRLGIAIRASVGTAVERNRARRRIRAIVRSAGSSDHDLIVGVDRAAARVSFQELEQHVGRAVAGAIAGRSA